MKRLFFFLIAGITGWWGYTKLRSHPRTAGKVAELERQGQLVVDKAGDVARSAKEQATGRAADVVGGAQQAIGSSTAGAQEAIGTAAKGTRQAIGAAATAAQEAIDAAADKSHEVVDAAAQKAREAINPVQDKIAELRADTPAVPGKL